MSLKNALFRTFSKDARKGEHISAKDAFEAVKSGQAILVDVREEGELRQRGLAESAEWLATSEIEARSPKWQEFVARLPKDKQIIVYCAAGVRAGRFAEELLESGYHATNMGGFDDWLSAGLPVKRI